MKTPGHRFKNKTKGIASSHSCTVEVLTARCWVFNTLSESFRGDTVTEGKFSNKFPPGSGSPCFANGCRLDELTRYPFDNPQREILGWADLCVSPCLQHILLSGTAVDESQLWDRSKRTWAEGTLIYSRLKQKTTLDKRTWEVEKEWETFAFSCSYSNGKARCLGLVFLFTIACSVQSRVGLPLLQISRWLLPYLTPIYRLLCMTLYSPTLRWTETLKKKKKSGRRKDLDKTPLLATWSKSLSLTFTDKM